MDVIIRKTADDELVLKHTQVQSITQTYRTMIVVKLKDGSQLRWPLADDDYVLVTEVAASKGQVIPDRGW